MLVLLSPAKSLNYDAAPAELPVTKRLLADDTAVLSKTTRGLSRAKLRELMGISEDLANLNYDRFQAFAPDGNAEAEKQAALAFNGDVYIGLDAETLDKDALEWSQNCVRILSGFYGVLRPLDGMQPYRLEMGIKLKTRRGENLYEFWGDRISKQLNEDIKASGGDEIVVNLASNEYFKSVDKQSLKARIITCDFKDVKDGKARTLGFFAKKARGLMARYIIENRITEAEGLKGFNSEGYSFDADMSSKDKWVFKRPQPTPKGK
ncbi:peroxide stress protein YaaA [Hirschia baltica]|uniref:UPF0246 protein Hbal_1162 n=1 Tax=Hirschia baltica (strain ATCC 49814 / DSM 5838 / IFAM 1418) TaxID=582402 RepID=C6XI28_HIRBI|nr:peroxide stress protein YaaA [Hirschia baltica]ACT58854.1 protein of unknown function DUF328 [Hirschia baltica ATCC 49814]